MNIKELAGKLGKLAPGHRTCAGCAAPIIVRLVMSATDKPLVIANATGCMEVASTIYPYTSWKVPYIHNAFENAAATLSGVETAYRSLKKQGRVKEDIRFIAFGGDGGTYDIGLQSLSGALERGHRLLYVCYNNEGYMNTGIQRSSATPRGAATTTTPAGSIHPGKEIYQKDLTQVVAGHGIKYVAQAAVHNWNDLVEKARKALEVDGPSFINVLSSCIPGWKIKPNMSIEASKIATESNFWPLYEVIDGEYKLSYKPSKKVPVSEFMKMQGRFKHLFNDKNKHIIDEVQKHVDNKWRKLLKMCGEKE